MMDGMMGDKMEKKEPMFKCPSCGEMLKVETKEDDMGEDMKPKKKMNTGNMPMGDLKSKINPMGNMNSY